MEFRLNNSERKLKKSLIGIIVGAILILIVLIGSIKKYTEDSNILKNKGNNINTSKIEESLQEIKGYRLIAKIKITSNKNENEYEVIQEYHEPNMYKTEVISPEKLNGLITSYDGKNLTIQNTKLNVQNIIEEYEPIVNNNLYFNTFIEDYLSGFETSKEENEKEIVLSTNIKNSYRYANFKKLHIDKETKLPTKMEVQDNNQNTKIYIEYSEINFK